MTLRSSLEQATHRIIVRRRLPAPFADARIYASSEGGLRYLARGMTQVDPPLLWLAAETFRPGDTVWDIGANLGLFSFAAAVAAGPAGSVLAVEPDTKLAGLLRRSAALNKGHAPVDVLPAAVSDDLSVARFHIAKRNRSTNYLDGFGTSQTGGVRTSELVPTFTLDWLADHFAVPDITPPPAPPPPGPRSRPPGPAAPSPRTSPSPRAPVPVGNDFRPSSRKRPANPRNRKAGTAPEMPPSGRPRHY